MKANSRVLRLFSMIILSFSCGSYAEVKGEIKKERMAREYVCEELCKNVSLVVFHFYNTTKIDISSIVTTPENSLRKRTSAINNMRAVRISHFTDLILMDMKHFPVNKSMIRTTFHIKKNDMTDGVKVEILMISAFTVYKDEKYCSGENTLSCLDSIFEYVVNEAVVPHYLSSLPKLQMN